MSESDRWHNTLWLGVARHRVQSIPALLLLLAVLIGVMLGGGLALEWGAMLAVAGAMLLLSVWLYGARAMHVVVAVLLIGAGYVAAQGAEADDRATARRDNALHRYAVERMERFATSGDEYAVVEAMVVGRRERISEELRQDYSITGFAHILAVSGLHLGVVMMFFGWLFFPLGVVHRGHRLRSVGVVVLVWLYVAMTGASPSTMRAAVMLSVLVIARDTGMSYLSINSILLTIALMLLYDANYIQSLSFQLSVAAVMGIVLWALPLIDAIYLHDWPCKKLLTMLVIGVVATMWVLPLISYTFGNLPLMSILVTPFLMILIYAILALGVVMLFLPVAVGGVVCGMAEGVARLHNLAVAHAADTPWFVIEARFSGYEVVAIYLVFILLSFVVKVWSEHKFLTLIEDDDREDGLQFGNTEYRGGA